MATILIIDDDPNLLESLSELLRTAGYHPVTAQDGQQALAYLQQHGPPCAIVLDLIMPGMDGWAFREAQRRDAALATVPTVIVTGAAHAYLAARGDPGGAVFPKPFDFGRLLDAIRRLCE